MVTLVTAHLWGRAGTRLHRPCGGPGCRVNLAGGVLTLTTLRIRLLAVPRSLGVPRIFILIIAMAYRYIFLLLTSEEPTI